MHIVSQIFFRYFCRTNAYKKVENNIFDRCSYRKHIKNQISFESDFNLLIVRLDARKFNATFLGTLESLRRRQ